MNWVCEWHSDEAANIVAEAPTTGRVTVKYCPKCHCVTFHARIADTATGLMVRDENGKKVKA